MFTRQERRHTHKITPIIKKCVDISKLYYPGENVTQDEQLVGFRGRCHFKQYILSKPAKYRIKIWTLCDSAVL